MRKLIFLCLLIIVSPIFLLPQQESQYHHNDFAIDSNTSIYNNQDPEIFDSFTDGLVTNASHHLISFYLLVLVSFAQLIRIIWLFLHPVFYQSNYLITRSFYCH
ncbi:hypothetical protein [Gracilibacillus kekensis]|uniref:Uncharacterized protein n=1 Tax=Gracilibacillus kekensis TaxID=1027249 RepID=A0A1M7QJM8_9BACI|nr:hypothetical protein [Gracilibacillus kekensis]SHN31419.1 hypothetical protein SAMN05216179_3275 [Gracilibacillus kekensis]